MSFGVCENAESDTAVEKGRIYHVYNHVGGDW